MPSALPRIQVCADPALYAAITTIAKGRAQSISHTAAQLLQKLLDTDEEIQREYAVAEFKYGAVPLPEDNRVRGKQKPQRRNYDTNQLSTRAAAREAAEEVGEGIGIERDDLIESTLSEGLVDDVAQTTANKSFDEKKELLKQVMLEILTGK